MSRASAMAKRKRSILSFFEPKRRAEEPDGHREAERREPNHGHRSEEPDGHAENPDSCREDRDEVSDIATVVCMAATASLEDETKYHLIRSRKPAPHAIIPIKVYKDSWRWAGTTQRSLNCEWFDSFSFLAYSEQEKGLYCLACVLFSSHPKEGASRAQKLITVARDDWKHAKEDLRAHAKLQYHLDSECKMHAFIDSMEQPDRRIDVLVHEKGQEQVMKNRGYIKSIVKCLEFAAREGIALRGHRDDSTSATEHAGKFQALINFRIESGDTALEKHLHSCQRYATYVSKTSQNDLLQCMGQYVQSQIVAAVLDSSFYGIMADEVTDVSGWEQVGVAVRYVQRSVAVERLVEFVACTSVKGEDLCMHILSTLQRLGLDPNTCRAQTYDGAGCMSGYLNGCQAKFREQVPRALYYHCGSHQLNLVLSRASDVSAIQCMLFDLKALGIFFRYSPKRQRQLECSIESINTTRVGTSQPLIPAIKLKLLCETRWVERHTALFDFSRMYEAVVRCLASISSNTEKKWDSKSVTDAHGLLHAITSDSFLVAFQTNMYFFGYTKGLSTLLQGSALDILTAFDEVQTVKRELQDIRSNAEKEFSSVFQTITEMAHVIGKEPGIPRTCVRQTQRVNVEGQTPEGYWRVAVFVPFLDNLLTQLNTRFTQMSREAVQGLLLLPQNLSRLDDAKISQLKVSYLEDLPQPDLFIPEVRLWKRMWASASGDLLQSLSSVLSATNDKQFPNICTILKLLIIIPVTTATVERGNSSLKYIKTDLRSTMGQ